MIVGICGLIGSGKGTVADRLVENHGFKKNAKHAQEPHKKPACDLTLFLGLLGVFCFENSGLKTIGSKNTPRSSKRGRPLALRLFRSSWTCFLTRLFY